MRQYIPDEAANGRDRALTTVSSGGVDVVKLLEESCGPEQQTSVLCLATPKTKDINESVNDERDGDHAAGKE